MVHDKPGSESEQRAAFSAFLTGLKGESWHQLQRNRHRALNAGLGTVGVRNTSLIQMPLEALLQSDTVIALNEPADWFIQHLQNSVNQHELWGFEKHFCLWVTLVIQGLSWTFRCGFITASNKSKTVVSREWMIPSFCSPSPVCQCFQSRGHTVICIY